MKRQAISYLGLAACFSLCAFIIGHTLYKKSRYIDNEANYKITETIEQLKAADARWNEDVLKSRFRLNQNYDPIIESTQQIIELEENLSSNIDKITKKVLK